MDGPFCSGWNLHRFTMSKYFSCVATGDAKKQDYSNIVLPMFRPRAMKLWWTPILPHEDACPQRHVSKRALPSEESEYFFEWLARCSVICRTASQRCQSLPAP